MSEQPTSPRIVGLSWGQIEVEGGIRCKDAKLYPGGSREWVAASLVVGVDDLAVGDHDG